MKKKVTRGRWDAPTPEQTKAVLRGVRETYKALEAKPIQRFCERRTECCQFHLTGRVPMVTLGEALLAAQAVRASGRKVLPEQNDATCPMLEVRTGRCLIYLDRPLGCRTHFCTAAGGPLERATVLDSIRKLETLDEQLGGCGPRPFPIALSEAMKST